MNIPNMEVIFLHHSSFLITLDRHYLLFDYFRGDRLKDYRFTGVLPELEPDKPLYVFASHGHKDHFDVDVLHLAQQYPDTRFVFSKDCRPGWKERREQNIEKTVLQQITYVVPHKEYRIDDILVRTLPSNEAGVAFVVETEEKKLYHAGDLNWWYWEGVGELVNGRFERGFKRAMRSLEDEHFNLAFVPLDPRMGKDAFKGISYFMRHVDADHVIPMHMWQDYSLIERFKARTDNDLFLKRLVDIHRENETVLSL